MLIDSRAVDCENAELPRCVNVSQFAIVTVLRFAHCVKNPIVFASPFGIFASNGGN